MVELDKPALSRRDPRNAGGRPARSRPLATRCPRASFALGCPDRKNPSSSDRHSAWTKFRSLRRRMAGEWRLEVRAGGTIDREERLRDQSARFRRIRGALSGSTFTIAGEGPLQQQLQSRRAIWAFRDKVFVSRVSFRKRNCANCSIRRTFFCIRARLGADGNQEGVPNSMLEAMASGLPVFATEHGGIPEAIENDHTGILVAERDHRALAEKLLELVQSGDCLSALAQRGAESVAEKFNDKMQARLLEDFYFEAMNERA